MTTIKPIDTELRAVLEDMVVATYLDGQCYEMAIALNRGLGWPIVGLILLPPGTNGELIVRHTAVRHPDGGIYDARGLVTEEEFVKPFGVGTLIDFEMESDLRKHTRPITEHAITSAGKAAMSLWPELPWTSDSFVQSVLSFVNDLERLCKRHGFWLAAPVPSQASWPMIVLAEGDESYEIVTAGYGSYVVNRVLK